MTIENRLKNLLSKFKVYDTDNLFIKGEISAYSYGLNLVLKGLELLEREAFIHTAQDFGITEKEHYYDRAEEGLTLDERRKRLIKMMTIGESDFTKSALISFLDTYPAAFTIQENPFTQEINIIAENSDWVNKNIDFLNVSIGKFMPAHLNFVLTVNS